MTGPPTPPPSSATEIEDAARTTLPPPQAAPATEPVAPAPAPPPPEQTQPTIPNQTAPKTAYELLFPSITELARSGSVRDLIQVAERGDLSVCIRSSRGSRHHPHWLSLQADSDKDQTRLLIVAPLVLAYMIVDEMYALFS